MSPGISVIKKLRSLGPSEPRPKLIVSAPVQGGVTLRAGPLNYLFVHSTESGAYCLGVFDNHQQGTLLGGITFRNVYVQVCCRLC